MDLGGYCELHFYFFRQIRQIAAFLMEDGEGQEPLRHYVFIEYCKILFESQSLDHHSMMLTQTLAGSLASAALIQRFCHLEQSPWGRLR